MAEPQPVKERQARLAAMQGESVEVKLQIGGMSCGGCVGAVEQALAAVPGVEGVAVDLESGTAVVAGAASIGRFRAQRLIQAVIDTGKEASLVPSEVEGHGTHSHGHGHGGTAVEDHHHGHAHDSEGNCVGNDHSHGHESYSDGHGHGHGGATASSEDHHHGHAHDADGNCVGHGHSHGHGHGHGHVLDEAKPLPSSKGRDITILYGSQTGTAQDVAEGLGRDAERYAIDAHVCAMDDIPRDLLPSLKLLVIVCSTTGDGTTPDNMKMNYRALLRKSLSPTYLAGVRFAIFGLGDSSYAKYNASARRLWVRMQQLGATPLLTNPGLGDDQEQLGYDAALEPWADALWTRLLAPDVLPLPPGVKPQRDGLMPPRFRVEEIGQPPIDNHAMQVDDAGVDDSGVYSSKHPYLAEISSISKVTPAEHFQDVRLVEIDLGNSGMTHPPGAVLSVLPRNLEPDAKDFCELLGLDPAQWVRLVPSAEKWRESMPTCCDVHGRTQVLELVCSHLDFQGWPRRSFFKQAALLAMEDIHAQRLAYFASAEGVRDGMTYAKTEQHSCLEALRDFPSVRPPLDRLLELVPKLGPRHFSIASAPSAHLNKIELLVALVEYETKLKVQKRGVCSAYLSSLAATAGASAACPRLPIWLSDGSLKLPTNPSVPLLLVGPGTGVAPFRSFLEDRQLQRKQAQPAQAYGDVHLFFGCRNKEADFYFAEQWEDMLSDGTLAGLHTAFSRDGESKVYVQQRIKDAGATIWPLLVGDGANRPPAVVYVAGNATNMPAAVRRAFVSVVTTHGGLGDAAAEGFVRTMEKAGRYQTETWA